jgi:cell wall-associated NlpC family hydrolase
MRRIYAVAISLALLVAAPGVATAVPSNKQAIDYVLSRALSQRGVPYSYGGGNTAGPSAGIVREASADPATGIVADANVGPGLTTAPTTSIGPQLGTAQLGTIPTASPAVAGVGIKMPRSSGEQYKVGRKVLPAEALPGDLIFFGPDGTQSVALFLGNGQMLEATDPAVTVSPVRTNGMAPYLSRMIDWQ